MSGGQRFYEGDVLTVRGDKYRVNDVPTTPVSNDVIHYDLEAIEDGVGDAILDPANEGEECAYVLTDFHEIDDEDDITVIE